MAKAVKYWGRIFAGNNCVGVSAAVFFCQGFRPPGYHWCHVLWWKWCLSLNVVVKMMFVVECCGKNLNVLNLTSSVPNPLKPCHLRGTHLECRWWWRRCSLISCWPFFKYDHHDDEGVHWSTIYHTLSMITKLKAKFDESVIL